jgi:hypothetical protein
MSTPELGECAAFDGGRTVCEEYYGAHKMQEKWQANARTLNIPLSVVTWSSMSSVKRSPGWLQHAPSRGITGLRAHAADPGVHSHDNGEVRHSLPPFSVEPSSLYAIALKQRLLERIVLFYASVHSATTQPTVRGRRLMNFP